jgi:hypothetical protein
MKFNTLASNQHFYERLRFPYISFFMFTAKRCERSTKQKTVPDVRTPKFVEARGYVVPKDSMAEPKVVPAGKPRVVPAGKPKIILTNTNVHPAGHSYNCNSGYSQGMHTAARMAFHSPKLFPLSIARLLRAFPKL